MLSYFDLRNGIQFILEGQPYEVLEFKQMRKAQDVTVAQTKIRNLVNGKVVYRSFHHSDTLEEANIEKFKAKFVYGHKGKYVFCQMDDSSKRFELSAEQVGEGIQFLKSNELIDGLRFNDNIINISLPIKVQLRVAEAPPGLKGDSAKGGTKLVTLETGATVQVPLFIEEGDILEINTDTGEYSRRVQ